MKILVAGATGALGRQLVPRLVAAGHTVTGMTRTPSKQEALRAMGATPLVADALDPEQVAQAVAEARPEVIVHQLTALPGALDVRHWDRDFALTNRLRTDGTDHLLSAARAVGVRKFVAQSYAGWPSARTGGLVKTEDDPLDPAPPRGMKQSFEAIVHLERAVVGADWTEGVVLRYGGFYGPGTNMGRGGEMVDMVRKRRFPLIGQAGGVWSFVHIEDAAEATVIAVERATRGIYNIVDDEPAAVAEWLPTVARVVGAPAPPKLPRFVARVLAGQAAVSLVTESRGASNDKARRVLGWEPTHPTWRTAFAQELA